MTVSKEHQVHLILLTIFFVFYAFLILFPYFFIFLNSFKDGAIEFKDNPLGLPKNFSFGNYLSIFNLDEYGIDDFNLVTMFKNSIILCFVSPTLNMISTVTAGYFMAKYNFKGKKIVYFMYILPMILYICGTLTSTYYLIDKMHLVGSMTSIFIMSCGGTGMSFLLVYSLFRNVSDTYMEAAEIDGAGYYTIFFKVMLPHALGLIGTLWIMGFIGTWNDFGTPLVFLGNEPENLTLATGIYYLEKRLSTAGFLNQNYPVYYAGIISSVVPIIIVFLIFQDKIMKLSIGGGIKG